MCNINEITAIPRVRFVLNFDVNIFIMLLKSLFSQKVSLVNAKEHVY